MRTSPAQFELLVEFMVEHGDISKPSPLANGKMVTLRLWEELTTLLNSDGSGETKSMERWRKVWSDLKNNTKKKAARLHRAARGTGGGPACYIKLNQLEEKVLNIIGVQAATGLAIQELGFSEQDENTPPNQMRGNIGGQQLPSASHVRCDHEYLEPDNQPHIQLASTHINNELNQMGSFSSPPSAYVEIEVEGTHMSTPGPSHVNAASPVHVAQAHTPQQPLPTTAATTTNPRRTPTRSLGTPLRRRRLRPTTRLDEATRNFLRADEGWRNLLISQHQDYMEMRRESNRIRELEIENQRENNRIRELEIEIQREWRLLGNNLSDLLCKLVDKFCKE